MLPAHSNERLPRSMGGARSSYRTSTRQRRIGLIMMCVIVYIVCVCATLWWYELSLYCNLQYVCV